MLLKNMDYMLYYNNWGNTASWRLSDAGAAGFKFEKPDGANP
jgi:hypothetical protein